ncbi:MAG: PTS sugar transporter subunit IIA [Gemmatimonadaceae bacterium]
MSKPRGTPAAGVELGDREVRGVVAGHGDFADGMISAVQQISGRGEAFVALSNRGLGADEIEARLRAILAETGAHAVFTDLPAGSVTIVARRVARDHPGLVVVTGTNLATLLDFVFHGELPAGEAAEQACDKGRRSIVVHGSTQREGSGGD